MLNNVECMNEIFKEHPVYACKISNFGNVLTLDNKPFKISKNQRYLRFQAVDKVTYDIKFLSVHRIVTELFIGVIPNNNVVNHIDGNKHNNCVTNLEIVSYSDNTAHAYKLGLIKGRSGIDHHNAKLNKNQVLEIYTLIKNGYTNNQIAEKNKC